MYIISKKSEKDYYDGVAGTMGIDKTIVYDRQIIELDKDKYPTIFKGKRYLYSKIPESPISKLNNVHVKKHARKKYPQVSCFIIGFCGKLYPGFKFYSIKDRTTFGEYNVQTEYVYDQDLMKETLEEFFWGGHLSDSLDYINKFDALELFREFKAPSFVYDHDYGRTYLDPDRYFRNNPKFFVNPILGNYEFYKIFDTFQAFQEIQMFLSGVLGNKEKDIVQVDDKYKITQHGFDKWSFRKEPQKK